MAPSLELLRRHPEFLIANAFDPSRVTALLLGLLVVAPLPWVAAGWLLRRSTGRFPVLLLALPATLSLLSACDRLFHGWWPLAIAGGAVTAVCLAYPRAPVFRRYVSLLAIVALIAPLRFLLDARVRHAIARPDVATVGEAEGGRPPVVFLLLDEVPVASLLDDAGALDRRRFPNLAALAADAHWFDNVRSIDPSTPSAVTAMLAGIEPRAEQVPTAIDFPRNLFTLLAPHYRIAAIESATALCPPQLNSLGRTVDSWGSDVMVLALHTWAPEPLARRVLPPIQGAWGGFAGNAGVRRGLAADFWRRALGTTEKFGRDRPRLLREVIAAMDGQGARLYFLHLMLPHRPWNYLPDGGVYRPDSFREMRDFTFDRWPKEPQVAARAYQRHLLQLEFTDRLVGELVDRLRAVGVYDSSLIVVSADHGISFRPGDAARRLSATNSEDLLQVPLFVKLPGQQIGAVHHEARTTLDVLPTVLAAVDLDLETPLAGQPLRPAHSAPSAAPPPTWSGLTHRASVFGSMSSSRALFAFGAYGGLVGRRVADLEMEQHPEIVIALGRDAKFLELEAEQALPAWLYGYVETDADLGGFGLAAAVDGTIVAVDTVLRVEGRNRINLLLPSANLAAGSTQLELFAIPPEPTLDRLWRTLIR